MTDTRPVKVYEIEAGEKAWVVARTPAHAIDLAAECLGMATSDFLRDHPDHTVREMDPTDTITILLDSDPKDSREELGLPSEAILTISAVAFVRDWIRMGRYGVIGSTVF